MKRQNITLSLPKELVKRAKIAAIKRDTSLSNLIRQALEAIVEREENYESAMESHFRIMEEGIDLKLGGKIPWKREQLYER